MRVCVQRSAVQPVKHLCCCSVGSGKDAAAAERAAFVLRAAGACNRAGCGVEFCVADLCTTPPQ